MKKTKRVLVGHTAVDSGQVMITDPCYMSEWKHGDFDPDQPQKNDYDAACRLTTETGGCF